MTNKYSRLKPKIKPLPIIIMVVMVVVFIVAILLLRPSASKKIQNSFNNVISNAQEKLPNDHVFVEISYKEYKKKEDKKENFLMFVGNPYDQASPGEVKYYDSYFKSEKVNEKLTVIYYLDSSKLNEEQTKELTMLSMSGETLQTPQLFYFHDGLMIYSRNDTAYTSVSTKPQGQIQAFFRAVYNKL